MLEIHARAGKRLEKIEIVTADGRRFSLGRPDSRLFPLRRRLYLWRRRRDIAAAAKEG